MEGQSTTQYQRKEGNEAKERLGEGAREAQKKNEQSSLNSVWPQCSSHLQRWIFSPQQLHALRSVTHAAACAAVKQLRVQRNTSHLNSSSSGDATTSTQHEKKKKKKKKKGEDDGIGRLPRLNEVLQLTEYFALQLLIICKKKNLFRQNVLECACLFFHRFWLRRSPLQYDVRLLLLACLLLALKAEDVARHYSLGDVLGDIEGLDVAAVLRLELPLCEAIDFDVYVLHSRPPLLAIIHSMNALVSAAVSANPSFSLSREKDTAAVSSCCVGGQAAGRGDYGGVATSATATTTTTTTTTTTARTATIISTATTIASSSSSSSSVSASVSSSHVSLIQPLGKSLKEEKLQEHEAEQQEEVEKGEKEEEHKKRRLLHTLYPQQQREPTDAQWLRSTAEAVAARSSSSAIAGTLLLPCLQLLFERSEYECTLMFVAQDLPLLYPPAVLAAAAVVAAARSSACSTDLAAAGIDAENLLKKIVAAGQSTLSSEAPPLKRICTNGPSSNSSSSTSSTNYEKQVSREMSCNKHSTGEAIATKNRPGATSEDSVAADVSPNERTTIIKEKYERSEHAPPQSSGSAGVLNNPAAGTTTTTTTSTSTSTTSSSRSTSSNSSAGTSLSLIAPAVAAEDDRPPSGLLPADASSSSASTVSRRSSGPPAAASNELLLPLLQQPTIEEELFWRQRLQPQLKHILQRLQEVKELQRRVQNQQIGEEMELLLDTCIEAIEEQQQATPSQSVQHGSGAGGSSSRGRAAK